ncbi:hypothetical protein HHI36_022943, partial [Cryptolaemus montrouzieri]
MSHTKDAIQHKKFIADENMIKSAKNPVKCMWDIINSNRGRYKYQSIASVGIDPDHCNNYFSNIAHNLIPNIPITDKNPLDNLEGSLPPSIEFSFRAVSYNEVRDIINNLKNRNIGVSGFEPDFLYPLENVTIAQGRDATFTCVVNNLGGYRVSGDPATAR